MGENLDIPSSTASSTDNALWLESMLAFTSKDVRQIWLNNVLALYEADLQDATMFEQVTSVICHGVLPYWST